jgi:hypothetical protein
MGGVSSRDHPITTAEDRRPGAYHRAKDLDPLRQGVPLEERLRLGLDSSTLLKNPLSPNFTLVAKQKAAVRLKHSSKAIPRGLPDQKPIPKTGTKKNEPTRRQNLQSNYSS